MTYDEFKTTFPVGSKLRILNGKVQHVIGYHDAEQIAILKWWRGSRYGWEYVVFAAGEMKIWKDFIRKA